MTNPYSSQIDNVNADLFSGAELSTDVTLGGLSSSDEKVPTENAVKTYIDTAVTGGIIIDHSTLDNKTYSASGHTGFQKRVITETDPPTVDHDESNYEVNDLWYETTNGRMYVLTDGTVGAAVWKQLVTEDSTVLDSMYYTESEINTLVNYSKPFYNLRATVADPVITYTWDALYVGGWTYSKSHTVDLTVSGIGGIDTGTENNIIYYIWALSKADGTTGLVASASSTSPTLPSGYVNKTLIGSWRNSAGVLVSGIQIDYDCILDSTVQIGTVNATMGSAADLDLSSYLPAGTYAMTCQGYVDTVNTGGATGITTLTVKPKLNSSVRVATLYSRGSGGGAANVHSATSVAGLLKMDSGLTINWQATGTGTITTFDGKLYLTGYSMMVGRG